MKKWGFAVAALSICILAACGSDVDEQKKPDAPASAAVEPSAPASATAQVDPEHEKELAAARAKQIEAETIVRFPQSSLACLTKDALGEALDYGAKGEQTKMLAMVISESNPDGQCTMLDPKKRYKVISAEYNIPDSPDMGLLEIVGEKTISKSGAWTVSWVAEPVKKR
ncbi:hypothetical protein PanNE5_29520 [Pandoraea sp. NE5]|nr:hypothetical protein PanNE5_29520 [Pandoraea sp. NE5]